MTGLWPWAVLAGLGMFHGLNPAMGWLFAVALGLYRQSRAVVLLSLVPIALGHALSIALVAFAVVALGIVVDRQAVEVGAGALLMGWALWLRLAGRRHRTRVGMRTGMVGLGVWSFAMASAHGAGLMLVPALLPLCLAGSPAGGIGGAAPTALAAVGVHTAALLVVTGAIALAVYEWIGLSFLRRGWINLDAIWSGALAATGALLLAMALV